MRDFKQHIAIWDHSFCKSLITIKYFFFHKLQKFAREMLQKLIRPDYYDEDYVLNEYEFKGTQEPLIF